MRRDGFHSFYLPVRGRSSVSRDLSLRGQSAMVRTVVLLAVGVIALAQSHTDNAAEAWSRAIRSNNVQQVQSLLQAGANPNTEDNFGNTPLMLAAAYASHDMLEALIKAGAGVNRTNRSGA